MVGHQVLKWMLIYNFIKLKIYDEKLKKKKIIMIVIKMLNSICSKEVGQCFVSSLHIEVTSLLIIIEI